MALSSAVCALKQGLLRHMRIPLQQQGVLSSAAAAGTCVSLWRGFAGGSHLDKDEVIQRVLEVTKHFEKIDPAKVCCAAKPCWVVSIDWSVTDLHYYCDTSHYCYYLRVHHNAEQAEQSGLINTSQQPTVTRKAFISSYSCCPHLSCRWSQQHTLRRTWA